MSILTLYTRSFHPDEAFGLGGLGFKGDNRGFSSNPAATARIHHIQKIDLQAARFEDAICDSDPSANWALKKIGVDMSNDYSQKRKKPRHTETPRNITPYRIDGDQSVNIKVKYAGKNFAFFGSNTDAGHAILGGSVSDGGNDTESGSLIPWGDRWSGFVPDLDVTNEVSLRINRIAKKAVVTCRISGDGFPNCESFIIDGAGNVLFLASHIRVGTAMTQLPGGRAISMCYTLLEVDWNTDDTFGSQVMIQFAHDFASSGGPFELTMSGSKSRGAWNQIHTGRDASGPTIRQVEDNVWLPSLISPAY